MKIKDDKLHRVVEAGLFDPMSEFRKTARCEVGYSDGIWTVNAWYTDSQYRNQGLGKQVFASAFKYLFETYGEPVEIRYTWNGQNEYVGEWIRKHFKAECLCPMAVLKSTSEGVKEGHLYHLDAKTVKDYVYNV